MVVFFKPSPEIEPRVVASTAPPGLHEVCQGKQGQTNDGRDLVEADAACSGPQRARRSKGRSSDPVARSKTEAAGRGGMGSVYPRIRSRTARFSPLCSWMSLPTNERPKQGNGNQLLTTQSKKQESSPSGRTGPPPLSFHAQRAADQPANQPVNQPTPAASLLPFCSSCSRCDMPPRQRAFAPSAGFGGETRRTRTGSEQAGRCACRPAPKGVREGERPRRKGRGLSCHEQLADLHIR